MEMLTGSLYMYLVLTGACTSVPAYSTGLGEKLNCEMVKVKFCDACDKECLDMNLP